jgi:hypothetical protein
MEGKVSGSFFTAQGRFLPGHNFYGSSAWKELVTGARGVQCCQLADCSAAKVKRGRIKSGAAGQTCGRILAGFEQKGPKRDQTFKIIISLLVFSLILGKFKKFSHSHRQN